MKQYYLKFIFAILISLGTDISLAKEYLFDCRCDDQANCTLSCTLIESDSGADKAQISSSEDLPDEEILILSSEDLQNDDSPTITVNASIFISGNETNDKETRSCLQEKLNRENLLRPVVAAGVKVMTMLVEICINTKNDLVASAVIAGLGAAAKYKINTAIEEKSFSVYTMLSNFVKAGFKKAGDIWLLKRPLKAIEEGKNNVVVNFILKTLPEIGKNNAVVNFILKKLPEIDEKYLSSVLQSITTKLILNVGTVLFVDSVAGKSESSWNYWVPMLAGEACSIMLPLTAGVDLISTTFVCEQLKIGVAGTTKDAQQQNLKDVLYSFVSTKVVLRITSALSLIGIGLMAKKRKTPPHPIISTRTKYLLSGVVMGLGVFGTVR